MAVTFDSKFEKGSGGSTSPFSFASNAGTVTGSVGSNSGRVLIAVVMFNESLSAAGTVTMTWAGTSMTQIGSQESTGGTGTECVIMFGLKDPATGNQTLSVSWTGGGAPNVALGAVSVFNADTSLTPPWQNFTSNRATSTAPTTGNINTANGNMVVGGHSNDNASSTTINVGTSAWIETALDGNYAEAYNPSSGATQSVSWTLGNSKAWVCVGVDVIAPSASVPIAPVIGQTMGASNMVGQMWS